MSQRKREQPASLLEMQTAEVQAKAELHRLARRRFQATVDWVTAFEWDFWVTLTCKHQVSERRIRVEIGKFEIAIRRRGQGKSPYFVYVVEHMPSNAHIHMLLRCRGR